MAVTAYEIHSGSSAQVSKDGSVTYTRQFKLNTENTNLRPAWGIVAIPINKYDPHPDDSTCLAIEVNSSPIDGELGWFTVTYTYSNRPFDAGTADDAGNGGDPGQNDQTQQPNPTLRTPTVRWGSNFRSITLHKDFNPDLGPQAVANSAKQPFDGFEVEIASTVMTLSFNMPPALNIATKKRTYENTVNNAAFAPVPKYGNYPKGELRCNKWDGTLQFEEGFGWYIACEVEIEYRRNGWQREVLDQGFYETFHDGTKYVNQKIIDTRTGFPIDAPAKLDGNGRQLKPNDNPAVNPPFFKENGGTPEVTVYKNIYPYEFVNWANLYA